MHLLSLLYTYNSLHLLCPLLELLQKGFAICVLAILYRAKSGLRSHVCAKWYICYSQTSNLRRPPILRHVSRSTLMGLRKALIPDMCKIASNCGYIPTEAEPWYVYASYHLELWYRGCSCYDTAYGFPAAVCANLSGQAVLCGMLSISTSPQCFPLGMLVGNHTI